MVQGSKFFFLLRCLLLLQLLLLLLDQVLQGKLTVSLNTWATAGGNAHMSAAHSDSVKQLLPPFKIKFMLIFLHCLAP